MSGTSRTDHDPGPNNGTSALTALVAQVKKKEILESLPSPKYVQLRSLSSISRLRARYEVFFFSLTLTLRQSPGHLALTFAMKRVGKPSWRGQL